MLVITILSSLILIGMISVSAESGSVWCVNCTKFRMNETINTTPYYNSNHPDILGTHLGEVTSTTITLDHYGKPSITYFKGNLAGIEISNTDTSHTVLKFHSADSFTIPTIYLKTRLNPNDNVSIRQINAMPICKVRELEFINIDNESNIFRSQINVTKYGFGTYASAFSEFSQPLTTWHKDTDDMNKFVSSLGNSCQINPYGETRNGHGACIATSGQETLNIDKSCKEITYWDVERLS